MMISRPKSANGSSSSGFDFTLHIRRLCDEMVGRVDELQHIDMSRVAVSFCQARKTGHGGMYASLTPLRFAGGRTYTVRRGRKWRIQRVHVDGREMLYVLSFYLPRFLDLPFREKLSTVVHELWHINPRFDGDLRRFGGRCYAHGGSQQRYEAQISHLVEGWLQRSSRDGLDGFLRENFNSLWARHGGVFGRKIPAPKLIPVESS